MASHGHGIARNEQPRTAEQKQKELDKINHYRDLDAQIRQHVTNNEYNPTLFALTSKILRINPEYYTIWNVRRRSLISGLFSKPSAGSWPSTALPTSSPTTTTKSSFDESYSCSSTETRPSRDFQTIGRSGTTADGKDVDGGRSTNDARNDGDPGGEDVRDEESQQKDVELIKSELEFTIPLLIEFPKCYWIWKYRLWLLQQAIERLSTRLARRIWEEELGLVSKMLTRDRRNFHAWGYRRQIVGKLEDDVLGGSSMVQAEFEYTTRMIRQDLSNFSAWHNRSKLIPRLLGEEHADAIGRKKFFDGELHLIKEALNVGPEDQSLWYYHQYLMLDLASIDSKVTMTRDFALADRVRYLGREVQDTLELLEDYDDCKLIYGALIDYRIAISRLEDRQPNSEESQRLGAWLAKLRELDPMRNGRWDDLARQPIFAPTT